MEVNEMLKLKEELEAKIADFIAEEVNEFLRKTGVGFKDIEVNIHDIGSIANKAPELYLVSAEVDLDI